MFVVLLWGDGVQARGRLVDDLVPLDGERDQFEAGVWATAASEGRAEGAVRLPHNIAGLSGGEGHVDVVLSTSEAARYLAHFAVAEGIVKLNDIAVHGFSLFL